MKKKWNINLHLVDENYQFEDVYYHLNYYQTVIDVLVDYDYVIVYY